MNIRLARELPRLYLFQQVVLRKSQVNAAAAIDVAPETLCQHLKALNAFCRVDLYKSRPRKTLITPQGIQLFEATNEALAHIESVLQQISLEKFFALTYTPPAPDPDAEDPGIRLPRGLIEP